MQAFLRANGLYLVFIAALALNIGFWLHSKHIREAWENVPFPPSREALSIMSLGDDEVAYRMTGYFLQNLGSSAGRSEALKDYDYNRLERWLFAANELDPYSNYIPYLVAYFYSASQNPEQVRYLINYLDANGHVDRPQKWRWSAQAVYLAQFIIGDNDLALEIAQRLALIPGAADWARQLPALVNLKMGNKEAAYGILLTMLDKERESLDPAEINAILDIICHRTLNKEEAAKNPLCRNFK